MECAWCGVEFAPVHKNKSEYRCCSPSCSNKALKAFGPAMHAQPQDDGAMPPDMDHVAPPPMKHMYTATCSQCAEAKDLLLTDQEARGLRPIRCERCGARVFVTLADRGLGSVLDPERPMPMQRYGGRTVRAVSREDIVA